MLDDSGKDALSEDGVDNNSELEDEWLGEVEAELRIDRYDVCTEIALCAEDDEGDLNEVATEASIATFDRIEDETGPQRPYPFWHELSRQ